VVADCTEKANLECCVQTLVSRVLKLGWWWQGCCTRGCEEVTLLLPEVGGKELIAVGQLLNEGWSVYISATPAIYSLRSKTWPPGQQKEKTQNKSCKTFISVFYQHF
jgi:hypothetical protein